MDFSSGPLVSLQNLFRLAAFLQRIPQCIHDINDIAGCWFRFGLFGLGFYRFLQRLFFVCDYVEEAFLHWIVNQVGAPISCLLFYEFLNQRKRIGAGFFIADPFKI